MAPSLDLWMLGPWQAHLNREQILILPSHQARVLLARLVLAHPHPMMRAALLEDLFPDRPIDQALQRLRIARYYLRHTLGDWLHDDNGAIGLDPSLSITCDVIEFLHDTEPGASSSELEAAIARYRGPLLDPAPDGWATLLASRIHERYIDALRRLIAMTQAAGTLETMVHAACHWAVEEPWEESAHIALLQALIARGERVPAAAQLTRARTLLRSEWGSEPSAIFEELGRVINRLPASVIDGNVAIQPEPDDIATLVVSLIRGSQTPLDTIIFDLLPLIGRTAELDLLIKCWNQVCQGQPQCIVIEGARGVGKSRLAQELAAGVQLRADQLVLWCQARTTPAEQWLQSLDAALSRLPESGRARVRMASTTLDEPTWSAICQMLPEVRHITSRPAAYPSPAGSPTAAAYRRSTALLALLDRLGAAGPLLLVYDDMCEIDPEFVAFIDALKASTQRVLIVITRNAADLQSSAGAIDSAADTSLLLAPLDDEATRHLICTILGNPIRSDLLERLVQQSGGSPRFACDILQPLLEHEALRHDPLLGWQLTLPDIPLPAGVIDLLTRRLEQLSTSAHTLASILALLGRPADSRLLEALWLDQETLIAAQAELLGHSILIQRNGQLSFDHTWLQQRLLHSIDAEERAAHHRLIAAALRRQPDADLAERMQHFAGAGEWTAALEDALTAARQALTANSMVTLQHALDVAQRAAEVLDYAPYDSCRWPLLQLQERYLAQVEHGSAWDTCLESLHALALAAGRVDWQVEALTRRGLALCELGQPHVAEGMLRMAADLAQTALLPNEEAWARLWLIKALDEQNAIEAALYECERVLDIARTCSDQELPVYISTTLGSLQSRSGQSDKALRLLASLEQYPIVQQNPKLTAHVAYTLGLAQLAAHHYMDGLTTLRESVRFAQTSGDTYQILIGQANLALVLAQFGLYPESRALSEATMPLAHRLADTRNLSMLLCSLALCWFYTGDAATAWPLVQEGAALSERGALPQQTAAHLRLAALIALELGQLDAAKTAIECAEQLPITPMQIDTMSAAARVWLALNQRAHALHAAHATIEHAFALGQPALGVAAALWEAAEVLSAIEGQAVAALIFARAIDRFLDDVSQLADPILRRAFITARPAYQAMAIARNGPRRLALLPLHNASTGRALYADELMPVVWTIDALDDPPAGAERRSRQVQRLAAEALEQGAVATVAALAEALEVTPRTIKRDLQSIRRTGVDVTTRRYLLRAVHMNEQPAIRDNERSVGRDMSP